MPDALKQGATLKMLCRHSGLVGIFPLDEMDLSTTPSANKIFVHNIDRLRACDCVIADISPFRGPHADDGTAFEMGFANALSKPIFGYTRDPQPLSKRIPSQRDSSLRLSDAEGIEVENFGLPQNLMLSCAMVGFYPTAQEAIKAAAKHLACP
jgi:nucleoside 2-deoxyribosyltransferase